MSEEMDRRMRDLMGRMVEMAPEAPPFPEETVTLSPAPPRRSMRPVLVFAGAAAAVLLVALPLLLLGGDTGVDPAVSTVPVPVPSTTAPEDPGTTAPVEQAAPVAVYFFQSPGNSPTGGDPALVPVSTLGFAPAGAPEALAALRALLDPGLAPPPGLETIIPDEVAVLGVVDGGGTITVDMNQAFLAGSGMGLLGDITMLNQLVYTATQGNPEAGVVFTVEGQAPGPYGSEGILLDTAFTRDYYLDSVNSVNITTPIGPESTEISGVANVFEATVAYEIRDAAGEVVESDFTMVACGTGCWGSFTIEVDPDLLEPGGEVRVFWNSPEDGEPSDVVTIPIPESEDGIWDLSS